MQQFASPTNTDSTESLAFHSGPVVGVTPNCKAGEYTGGDLPCLDLDFISLYGAVQPNQDNVSYTISPENCTSRALGCSVGWLARITPIPWISDGGNPATIVSPEQNSSPKSPIGSYDSADCSAQPCYSTWVEGSSAFQWLDLKAVLSQYAAKYLNNLISTPIPLSTDPSVVVPVPLAGEQDYMARFYSGGIDDFYELANLGQYADGKSEALAAFVLNIEDTAINIANAALSLLDADAATNIVTCAVLKGTMDQSVASATQTSGTVSGGMRLVTSTVKSILAEVPGCDTSEIASEGVDGAIALLAPAVPEVGAPIEGALDALQGTSDVAEAVQCLGEMAFSASPVETAVIAIQPGAPLPYNPAPSISALSPASAAVGGASQDVTIQGANLQSNSVVAINGTTHSSTLGTDGGLQITLTSSDLQQTADLLVTVTNPLPGGGTAEALFPVGSPTAPTPTITSLYPAAAIQSTPASTTVLQTEHSVVELFCGHNNCARPTAESSCGIFGWPGESRRTR